MLRLQVLDDLGVEGSRKIAGLTIRRLEVCNNVSIIGSTEYNK
jgi:hypothetical protein